MGTTDLRFGRGLAVAWTGRLAGTPATTVRARTDVDGGHQTCAKLAFCKRSGTSGLHCLQREA